MLSFNSEYSEKVGVLTLPTFSSFQIADDYHTAYVKLLESGSSGNVDIYPDDSGVDVQLNMTAESLKKIVVTLLTIKAWKLVLAKAKTDGRWAAFCYQNKISELKLATLEALAISVSVPAELAKTLSRATHWFDFDSILYVPFWSTESTDMESHLLDALTKYMVGLKKMSRFLTVKQATLDLKKGSVKDFLTHYYVRPWLKYTVKDVKRWGDKSLVTKWAEFGFPYLWGPGIFSTIKEAVKTDAILGGTMFTSKVLEEFQVTDLTDAEEYLKAMAIRTVTLK